MRSPIVVVAAVVWGISLLAQTQGPAGRPLLRSGVELIQIDVSVLDGDRHPITGLSEADFTVLENGVARPLRAFTAIDVPAAPEPGRADWLTAVAPDVVTNAVAAENGRLVIIMMDRTIPPGPAMATATRIATATVKALGPHDLAAVVSTSGGVPQNFTADRARLERALSQRDWSTDMSQDAKELLAGLDGVRQVHVPGVGPPLGLAPDPLSDGRCLCGVCVLDIVTRMADELRDASGRRKTLFFIGNSLIVQAPLGDPRADVACDRQLTDARERMFSALARSSMTVHSLDPGGLVNSSPSSRASSPVRGARAGEFRQTELEEYQANQESLGILPARTGGRRVINTNAPEEKVPEIFRESESYYVLGFERGEPSAPATPDATRKIEVKVARRGAHVYAQRQYVAPVSANSSATLSPPVTRPALDKALAGLLPAPARSLALGVGAFAGSVGALPGKASVAVIVDASSFARAGADVPLEIAIAALDRRGKQVASARRTATLGTPANLSTRVPEAAIETRFELPPGDYEVRVAVRDSAADTTASVFSQIVVPAFASAALSLSDIALETAPPPAAAGPSSASGGPPPAPRPIRSTTRRAFGHADQVHAYMQIYQALARTDAIVPVTVHVRIVDSNGRTVRDQSLTFQDAQFRDRRADCEMTIPVDHLAAGDYLLRLDAAAGKQAATRAVRFSVR